MAVLVVFAFQFQLGAATVGSGEYLIDVTTVEKGLPNSSLPNSSVTAIKQTPDGDKIRRMPVK